MSYSDSTESNLSDTVRNASGERTLHGGGRCRQAKGNQEGGKQGACGDDKAVGCGGGGGRDGWRADALMVVGAGGGSLEARAAARC